MSPLGKKMFKTVLGIKKYFQPFYLDLIILLQPMECERPQDAIRNHHRH